MKTKSVMRSRAILLVLAVAIASVLVACLSQEKALAPGGAKPVVDGEVVAREYTLQNDYGSVQVFLSLGADTLYVGLVGRTQGWVAVGLNSLKMDGATIFMGAVEEDGSVRFSAQEGHHHNHMEARDQAVSESVISYAVTEADGSTTLEIALKAETYIMGGQSSLDMIFGIGETDSFFRPHIDYVSQTVVVAQ